MRDAFQFVLKEQKQKAESREVDVFNKRVDKVEKML